MTWQFNNAGRPTKSWRLYQRREADFTQAEQQVAATYSNSGRPACRAGVLLRNMILQHLYGLTDPQVEEQIKDRLSTKDSSSWTLTRRCPMKQPSAASASGSLNVICMSNCWELLNSQLEAKGYIKSKRTTLVDATIVESSHRKIARSRKL